MQRTVVVILDGVRRDLLSESHTPNLMRFAMRAERFGEHRSVFPSATRVASASLATGCFPGRHELQGNTLVLLEDGRPIVHDAGEPDFLQHKRRVTGRSLAVPTLAQRVAGAGGAIVFSNVSPGAAYAHDADGYGFVHHRTGSFGPGRLPIGEHNRLDIGPDLDGDVKMVERFAAELRSERRPALALLWTCEPDTTQHEVPLGSPDHHAMLRAADALIWPVIDAVDQLRAGGDDVLLMIGSDHGHQTVVGVVDIESELVAAGLKQSLTSDDVISASNGTAALIYVRPDCAGRISALREFFGGREWVGELVLADRLAEIGQAPSHGLAFAISLRADEEPNAFGVPGRSLVAKPAAGKADRMGCGQHGGLGRYEQSPFLMIDGRGFAAGVERSARSSILDVAPTVLRHLSLSQDGMDGCALQSC